MSEASITPNIELTDRSADALPRPHHDCARRTFRPRQRARPLKDGVGLTADPVALEAPAQRDTQNWDRQRARPDRVVAGPSSGYSCGMHRRRPGHGAAAAVAADGSSSLTPWRQCRTR